MPVSVAIRRLLGLVLARHPLQLSHDHHLAGKQEPARIRCLTCAEEAVRAATPATRPPSTARRLSADARTTTAALHSKARGQEQGGRGIGMQGSGMAGTWVGACKHLPKLRQSNG